MIVLPESEKSKLAPLFLHDIPSKVLLLAYLQNRAPGIAYVDDLTTPNFCLVITEFHHISFVGWRTVEFDLAAGIKEVLLEEQYMDIVWEDSFPFSKPDLKFNSTFNRLEFFSLNQDVFHSIKKTISVVKGVPGPIDSTTFDMCESKDEHLVAFDVKENFLRNSFGIVLTDEGKYISDASSIFIGESETNVRYGDIQIVTSKDFRRQGYGLKVAVLLIEEMKSKGISPVWSCNKDNEASQGIARKLGFEKVRKFEILCIEEHPPFLNFWKNVMDKFGVTYEAKDEAIQYLRSEYQLPRQVAHWLIMRYVNLKSRT